MTIIRHTRKNRAIDTRRSSDRSKSEGLIEAHYYTRSHITSLLDGVGHDIWVMPVKGPWNLQSLGVEILNFEIRMLDLVAPDKFQKVDSDVGLNEFLKKFAELSKFLIESVRKENQKHGFLLNNDKTPKPSLHWVLMRINSHDMYHAGGLTVIREHLGLKRADYSNWPSMADAQFLAGLGNQSEIVLD